MVDHMIDYVGGPGTPTPWAGVVSTRCDRTLVGSRIILESFGVVPYYSSMNSEYDGANLSGKSFNGHDLRGESFMWADMRGCDLQMCDLRGVNLTGADLRGACLRDADLRGADICSADLRGADLSGAQYDPEALAKGGVDWER